MGSNGKKPQHGKTSTYLKHKCRCDKCVEFYKQYRAEQRVKNADSIKIYTSEYYQRNKEIILEKSKSRVLTEAQKEASRQRTRLWYRRNREYAIAYSSLYNKSNPELRRAINSRRRVSWQIMDELDRLLSTEYRKAIAKDKCFYCNKIETNMHDDHYFPLAKGGTDHWFNLVRSCQSCNSSKSAKCGTRFALRGGNV